MSIFHFIEIFFISLTAKIPLIIYVSIRINFQYDLYQNHSTCNNKKLLKTYMKQFLFIHMKKELN